MTQNLGEIKQKIRKYFLFLLECLLLFLTVICGPIWTKWPTGFFIVDFILWSFGFLGLIWGLYVALRKIQKRSFKFLDFFFHFLTFLLGTLFVSLAFLLKKGDFLVASVTLGLVGIMAAAVSGWELYKLGNRR